MQLSSIRTNQTFTADYQSGKLMPQTEVILLIEQPKYSQKGEKIIKGSDINEMRFTTSTNGIRAIIGMLEDSLKTADMYEKLGGSINNIIVNETVSH
jgi:hypothetical protein